MNAYTRELLLRVIAGSIEGSGIRPKWILDHIEPVIDEANAAKDAALEAAKEAVQTARRWLLETSTKNYTPELIETYLNMISNALDGKP